MTTKMWESAIDNNNMFVDPTVREHQDPWNNSSSSIVGYSICILRNSKTHLTKDTPWRQLRKEASRTQAGIEEQDK